MDTSGVVVVSLIAYKVILIGIGFWATRRIRDEADFLLGGRKLGPWVAGLSYAASTSSAWVLLGYSGFVYAFGIAAIWMVPGIWAGYAIMWIGFGPRVRQEALQNHWVTPTEFLCGGLRSAAAFRLAMLATGLIAFCFIFYIAAQFDAAAAAFVTHFEMDEAYALILGAVIILVYCLLGGFWAASVTDTLQAIVMLSAALLIATLAVQEAGGPWNIATDLARFEPRFVDITAGTSGVLLAGMILGFAGIGLGTLGQPHLLARLMAVRGEKERRLAFRIAIGWGILVYLAMTAMALAARSMATDPQPAEQVFYMLAGTLLPPVLAGVVIAAILSAVMSTVDSLLIAASAAVAHDLRLSQHFRGGALRISRIVMLLIVLSALTLALTLPETIFNRVLFAWNALGAAFGPLIIARVLGREPSATSRAASILTGFLLTVFFYSYGSVDTASVTGISRALADLAQLPGDPFERFIPFLPPLVIVFLGSRRAAAARQA